MVIRKRASKQAAQERRRLILESAQAVFAASNYARVGTADLARAAGVSEPALYRYFPSKRELYLSSLRAAGQRLLGIWKRAFDGAADPLDFIWTTGMGYYDHVLSRSPVMRLWFQALSEADDPMVRTTLAENFAAAVDLLEENLDKGKTLGLIRRDIDSRVAAWHFMAIGLTFDLVHLLGLHEELDRRKVEDWGRLYLQSVREERGEDAGP